MGPVIQQGLATRDLLPSTHLLGGGYVDAELLVTAQTKHQVDVVGPTFGSYSRQRMAGQGYDLSAFLLDWEAKQARCPQGQTSVKGYDLSAFLLDWEAKQARCPQGQTSVKWTPGWDVSGDPVVRIRFDRATCRVCPTRQACTWAKDAPRQLTVRPQAQHEAIQAARQR
jgi:transposase